MATRLLLVVGSLMVLGLLVGGLVIYSLISRAIPAGREAERAVSDFSAVEFTHYGDMTIIQGEREGLTIETDEDLLARIETTVRGDTLTIGFDNGFTPWSWFRRLRPPDSIRYTLYVRNLEALDLSGAGTIHASQLATDRLALSESGAGTISIDQLNADDLDVNISGAGSVKLAGQVENQRVNVSGLGSYQAGDLESQEAEVDLSGAGSITLWVRDQLDASISGAGSIQYYGAPQVTSSRSGVGDVRSLGEK